MVEPLIEQKGFKLHASTSKNKSVPVIDSTNRRTDDIFTA
jgi:hypothetical protein